jgi:hypothetical protein
MHSFGGRYDFACGTAAVSNFRVEVSGWDKHQSFFVEKSELRWSEQSGKQITLSSAIPDGAVVFLRLLPSLGADRSESVAYQTEFLQTTLDGRHRFRLHSVHPRVHRNSPVVRATSIQ